MKNLSKFLPIILVILFSIPLILPYIRPGFFPTHDGEWVVVRLTDMFRTLRDGQFPARYSGFLNHGFGYPLFNFTYPLPYYLGILIHFLRFSFVDSIKIIFAGSVIVSGISFFLLINEFWKNKWAALCLSVLYIYLPYRMVNLYVRGSIGESVSMAIFPIVFYFWLRLISRSTVQNLTFTAVFFAALIITHNIMAVYFTVILGVLCLSLVITKNLKALKASIISIFLGLGLSAFFWLPVILEKKFIALSQVPIANRGYYFLQPLDLILPKWGYGIPDSASGFGYQLGWPQVGAFLLVLLTLAYKRSQVTKLFLSLTVLTFFLASLLFSFSSTIWKVTPLLSDINYPWTLLAPLGFLTTFLSGWIWQFKRMKLLLPIFAISAMFLVLPHSQPRAYNNYIDSHYFTNDSNTTSSNELMPLWVKTNPTQQPENKVEIISGEGVIKNIANNSKQTSFDVDLKTESNVQINTIYYPGWEAASSGKKIPISYDNNLGVMRLALSLGQQSISLKFKETLTRQFANTISLVSLFVLVIFYLTSVVRGSRSERV